MASLEYPERNHFLTPSGTTVSAWVIGMGQVPGRDAEQVVLQVSSSGFATRKVSVILDAPPLIHVALQQTYSIPLTEPAKKTMALVATLDAIDQDPASPADPAQPWTIEVGAERAVGLLHRAKLSDRALRRYIARRTYDLFRRSTLDSGFTFDDMDLLTTGGELTDLKRNCQVLAEEGYLKLMRDEPPKLVVGPTAKLVRAVELYGAAPEDVVSERDYAAALAAYSVLRGQTESLLLERRRFDVARTPTELVSVFRAVAPTVEAIVRGLLKAHRSTKADATLGPMIGEMVSRRLGSVGLWSQLNHILSFGRDLTEHGEELPEPVLRIACENAFELVPQLGALFPQAEVGRLGIEPRTY